MLLDVEKVLSVKDISTIRPADLPSLGGEEPKVTVKRTTVNPTPVSPKRTTPSTGGGPFGTARVYAYKTKPTGILAVLVSILIGVYVVFDVNAPTKVSTPETIVEVQIPAGRILVVNDLLSSSTSNERKTASNKIAELGVAGWDLFVDAEKEASVRSWLPSDPISTAVSGSKLESENLTGILLIKNGENAAYKMYYVDQNGASVLP